MMHFDLLCPFATLGLSSRKKPIHALRPQLETHPAQAFSLWETLRSLRIINALSKKLPLTRSKYSPSSQNQKHLPSSYTNPLSFQPFHEHFQ